MLSCRDCGSYEVSGAEASKPRLFWQRWVMLFYLSALAMLSDWICFSLAPIPAVTERAFHGAHPSELVTIFLSTNVLFCLIEPVLVRRYGLRKVVVSGSALMFFGCLMRSGIPGSPVRDLSRVTFGTICVGAAQPFFQCTPALLAAAWFGPNERTLATTLAINANQIGIAAAYWVGTSMVHHTKSMHKCVLARGRPVSLTWCMCRGGLSYHVLC